MGLLSNLDGIVEVFPGGGVGMYGPTGFTRRSAVSAILDRYELDDPDADVVTFEGLPHAAAQRLLRVLPPNQQHVSARRGPSFQEMIDLTASCPSTCFSGFRVSARRFDERIVLDGFDMLRADVSDALRVRLHYRHPALEVDDEISLAARWE
jgi:hypothetical protein